MNRRDTIIIAVLLNAGLLIVLFATSLKSDSQMSEPQATLTLPEVQKVEPVLPVIATQQPSADAVDNALKQYVPITVNPEVKSSFAADLQAIGSLEPIQPSSQIVSTPTAPVAEVTYKEIKVKKGDVLERLARQHHVSVDEIMKANQLASTRLKIGQVLKIPSEKSGSAPATFEEKAAKFYVVKNGDNPWTIAVKNHMKVEELLKLNNIDEQQARRLKPGDKLKIK